MHAYRHMWKNEPKQAPQPPLDLVKVQPWHGDSCSMAFDCAHCSPKNRQFDTAYEVILEWGDTQVYENTDYLCWRCCNELIGLTRNAGEKTLEQVLDQVCHSRRQRQ
jgi:hypothetical protein